MNDRYFVALGWIGLALAVVFDWCERAAARIRNTVHRMSNLKETM